MKPLSSESDRVRADTSVVEVEWERACLSCPDDGGDGLRPGSWSPPAPVISPEQSV